MFYQKLKIVSFVLIMAILSASTAHADGFNKKSGVWPTIEPIRNNYRRNQGYDIDYSKFSVVIPFASYHIQERQYNDFDNNNIKRDFNEFNPGIGINYQFSSHFDDVAKTYISIGGFDNSFYEATYFALLGIETENSRFLGERIDFGAEFGVTHGYRDIYGDVYPVLPGGQIFMTAEVNKLLDFKLGLIPMSLAESFIDDSAISVDVVTASFIVKFGATR